MTSQQKHFEIWFHFEANYFFKEIVPRNSNYKILYTGMLIQMFLEIIKKKIKKKKLNIQMVQNRATLNEIYILKYVWSFKMLVYNFVMVENFMCQCLL